ncbi:MAG: hypothetical protein ABIP07_01705 [Sphingomicrobium sp.]
MKWLGGLAIAAATSAAAQLAPLSFDAGKSLPLSFGQWSYVPAVGGSEARFGSLLSLRCERAARTMVVQRIGGAPAVLTIATSSVTRTVPAGGRIAANDPLLDAIAFSRGRFLVAGGAGPVLALPSWPEAARSIEDCRN